MTTITLPIRTIAGVSSARHATVRDAGGIVLFTAHPQVCAAIVAKVNTNDTLIEALRSIRKECTGPDWTAEQALEFVRQHANETIKAAEGAHQAAASEIVRLIEPGKEPY